MSASFDELLIVTQLKKCLIIRLSLYDRDGWKEDSRNLAKTAVSQLFFQAKLFQINEDGLGVVVTSFKGGADGKGLRDAVESVVDDLEKVLL